jgi:hypothetical protein
LHLVTSTAHDIDTTAAEIWQRGQLVANNTVHIAKVHDIKAGVDAILDRAASIAGSAAAIKAHAESCPVMETTTILILISALLVLLFFAVIALALLKIVPLLEVIGGRGDSYLAKLRFGLRAIEVETSHLPAVAPGINDGLGKIAQGLMAVDDTLGGLHKALLGQSGGRP